VYIHCVIYCFSLYLTRFGRRCRHTTATPTHQRRINAASTPHHRLLAHSFYHILYIIKPRDDGNGVVRDGDDSQALDRVFN
jgi:hypothetical protein